MTHASNDGLDAGFLLRCGLRPRLRPSDDRNYRELVQRFQSDSAFADLTENIADGLGLRVLDVSERGIVLGSVAEGPFALKLDAYRKGYRFEDRVCVGLIQLAVAAYCYPKSEDLWDEDRGVFRITVHGVVKYLLDLCGRLQRESKVDAEYGSPEIQEAWRVVLSRAETKETGKGSRSRTTLVGMVAHAMDTLEREGMLRKESEDEGGTYHVLYRYRIQVRELGNLQAFETVQSLMNGVA